VTPAVTGAVLAASAIYDDENVVQPTSDLRAGLHASYPALDFHSPHLDPYWPAIEEMHSQQIVAVEENARERGTRSGFRTGFVVGALFAFAALTLRDR